MLKIDYYENSGGGGIYFTSTAAYKKHHPMLVTIRKILKSQIVSSSFSVVYINYSLGSEQRGMFEELKKERKIKAFKISKALFY